VTVGNLPVYPLHEVLEVKHRRVDQAENVVKEKKRLLEVEKEKLKQREAERDKVKQHHRDKMDQLRRELDQGTTSDKIDRCKLYLKVVLERLAIEEKKKVKEQQQQVDLAEKNLEAAKVQLKEREKERDKILTHKKEWTKETIKELQILETREEDEIGSIMFLTKMVRKKQDEAHHPKKEQSSKE